MAGVVVVVRLRVPSPRCCALSSTPKSIRGCNASGFGSGVFKFKDSKYGEPFVVNFSEMYGRKHVKSTPYLNSKIEKKMGSAYITVSSNLAAEENYQVVLTREKGKNGKLMKLLEKHSISYLEFPLIEHVDGPDRTKLPSVLKEEVFDWIVITSPEAANVFLEGWKEADFPAVNIAVVGEGTGKVFDEYKKQGSSSKIENLSVKFTPSKAIGKVLAAELPKVDDGNDKVLYPSSKKAGSDIQTGLEERGFHITRLNTYSTETVKDIDSDLFLKAKKANVLTFASPSSVKAWADLVKSENWTAAIACIGQTSADAATRAGFQNIFFPDAPGIEGWLNSILEALKKE